MNYRIKIVTVSFLLLRLTVFSQSNPVDSLPLLQQRAALEDCIHYALEHQPVLRQQLIEEEITRLEIRNRLADWYPQVSFNYNLQHNFQRQTSIFGGIAQQIGTDNTSALQFSLTQNLFNRDALLASRSREDVLKQAGLITSGDKIDIAVNVSKAFYEVLAAMQQIKIADEDIVRLERSLKDALSRYNAGITDKTDYKRATIILNNTRASRKGYEAGLRARLQYLKSLMGYPPDGTLAIESDSLRMERETALDTLQVPDYRNRVEYHLLETQKSLLQANLKYQKWSFLPSVSANGGYNLNFLNNDFGKLYNVNYPNSYAGITLSLPIFQGGKRNNNIRIAEWQIAQTDWDITALRNAVNAEYEQGLAAYKSNLANYLSIKENLELARDVYNVIELQYRSGVKTYLEVITAEGDLRTARINYINALYQLLSSKVDVQRALGQINY